MKTINTWLPLFSGFYNTIWEPNDQADQVVEDINEDRLSKGLEPIKFEDCEFDYPGYEMKVVQGIAAYVENELKGYVTNIEVERVVSPKEYNYRNDSANVEITLTDENIQAISDYLVNHSTEFETYLKRAYTSRSGFISFYPNNVDEFMVGLPLEDEHKLGSILQFICENEGIEEINAYYNIEVYLEINNYSDLLPD